MQFERRDLRRRDQSLQTVEIEIAMAFAILLRHGDDMQAIGNGSLGMFLEEAGVLPAIGTAKQAEDAFLDEGQHDRADPLEIWRRDPPCGSRPPDRAAFRGGSVRPTSARPVFPPRQTRMPPGRVRLEAAIRRVRTWLAGLARQALLLEFVEIEAP